MFKLVLFLTLVLVMTCIKLQFANLTNTILGSANTVTPPNSSDQLSNGNSLIFISESLKGSQLEAHQITTPSSSQTTSANDNYNPRAPPTGKPVKSTTDPSGQGGGPSTTTVSSNSNTTLIASGPTEPTTTTSTTTTTTTATTTTTTTPDSGNAPLAPLPPSLLPPQLPPDLNQPDKPNTSKPSSAGPSSGGRDKSSPELGILFYSVFIVYVSFVKLIYHNIHMINHNLTEQGILMIFGILWQLVARKLLSTDHGAFPRFNSRIFFYLFLPSTVLESASLLSNKWLFFNLLPILTHSIIGTVLYASSMGFTIFSLARSNVFAQNWIGSGDNLAGTSDDGGLVKLELSLLQQQQVLQQQSGGTSNGLALTTFVDPSGTTSSANRQQNELTLAECLIFGTILSSIDSAPMLTVFKQYQVNEKLYYLVLGENLMNNAVVITIFHSLIDLFETTKLTVFRVYLATLQFFANLVGAVFIGFALALFALISVRLTKRFQLPGVLLSYQNQCQAMVETLLILKLAYLTYTLAHMAGTSSIVGLATFGILNDQYIKHNLNLRSQLAFRQVILGMKTMGFSLVYPLLGMLLVDTALSQHGVLTNDFNESSSSSSSATSSSASSSVASSSSSAAAASSMAVVRSQVGPSGGGGKQTSSAKLDQTLIPFVNFQTSFQNDSARRGQASSNGGDDDANDDDDVRDALSRQSQLNPVPIYSTWNLSSPPMDRRKLLVSAAASMEQTAAASLATKKLTHLANQANLNWYVKFLSIVILLTVIYRFIIVISLGLIGNVLTCGQLKIKFKEQLLMAYGGFKGPLSMALVHSLMEHDNHIERNPRNKHLFKYTVLMNIFISAVLAGTFIRPLVARIQTTLIGRVSTNLDDAANPTIVFDHVNYKLTEYVSHGLNSILGHSRSPYEKFIEFNETHIKPWLVRGGSNTNWLSVFYDNLILDETLNANCFHIATEDPTTMRAFRNSEWHNRQRRVKKASGNEPVGVGGGSAAIGGTGAGKWSNMWRRRSSSVSFLDTIDEMPTPAAHAPSSSHTGAGITNKMVKMKRPKVAAAEGVSMISADSSLAGRSGQLPEDQDVLKEFVMFNLKLENAKRRRRVQKRRLTPPQLRQQEQHEHMQAAGSGKSPIGPIRPKFRFDNSSSNLTDSSLDRASRRAHLDELEVRLAGSGEASASRTALDGHGPEGGQRRPLVSEIGSKHGGTFDRGQRVQISGAERQHSPPIAVEGSNLRHPSEPTRQGPGRRARYPYEKQ